MGHVVFILGMVVLFCGVVTAAFSALTYFFNREESIVYATVAISCVAGGGIIGFIGFVIIYVSAMFA